MIFSAIHSHARRFGRDSGPGGMAEANYVLKHFAPGSRMVDVGGGEGKLANRVAKDSALVVVLDREETLLEGADNRIYEGSLDWLVRTRVNERVIPLKGDATESPAEVREP